VFLAGLASAVAGITLALASVWSMNIFDVTLMALVAVVFARLVNSGRRKY